LKHQLKTDIRGVNVWSYALVMPDGSSQVNGNSYGAKGSIPVELHRGVSAVGQCQHSA